MTELREDVQLAIDALDQLPASPRVAVRIIELSMDEDATIDDYVELVSIEPMLTSKIIAVANSPWSGVSRTVTNVKQAIGLLGSANVRVLALSHSVGGIHHAWKLSMQSARAYWEASLCKASAARVLASDVRGVNLEELFAAALLQDIGITLLASVGGPSYAERLLDPTCSVSAQIAFEREHFGADHAEIGQLVAEKIGLPEPYPGVIAKHHELAELNSVLDATGAGIEFVASLLPHDLRSWKSEDIGLLGGALRSNRLSPSTAAEFLAATQSELEKLGDMLGHEVGNWPDSLLLAQHEPVS